MELSKGIDVTMGSISARIFGGTFRAYHAGERRLVSVKMAEEINRECDISIPTQDFSVPSTQDMQEGVRSAIKAMSQGNDIYVGCMGGIGRTGLFMGVMAKVAADYAGEKIDPVKYVRRNYYAHAIETAEQQEFVRTFDTTEAVKAAKKLQVGLVDVVVVKREVFVPIATRDSSWSLCGFIASLFK